ncbi:KR domain-containing protein [Nostoc sphaeroides CCNUC1]|uniref:KR domain-containing protein n=1 Tax=Nostoc sphaeroides CCNUC1 TaxID=2653204 RepID=A0A5P8W6Q6_9NOSO|nr:KR domain-containing protein [Nostoc sphaeroides CCNUC1]
MYFNAFLAKTLLLMGTRDWGLGTGDWGLGTRDWGLGTRD